MALPTHVRLFEVGPRDGLQNESRTVDVATKVELIERLVAAGLTSIECGSFVSPRWVPQMADTGALLAAFNRPPGVTYSALVPNLIGLERALQSGLREVAVFVSASETFSQKNINATVAESLDRSAAVVASAVELGLRVRGYVSCVLGCPFEGEIAAAKVADVAHALVAMGCYEVSLGDTIGVGTPLETQRLLATVAKRVPIERLAVHFHDTYGQAIANCFAALQMGVGSVDSAVAGLGGCPYAPGASGNVATEDVVYLLEGLGIPTGIDLPALASTGHWISAKLGRTSGSRVAHALAARTREFASLEGVTAEREPVTSMNQGAA